MLSQYTSRSGIKGTLRNTGHKGKEKDLHRKSCQNGWVYA